MSDKLMVKVSYWDKKELLINAIHVSKLLLDRNINPRTFLDLVEDECIHNTYDSYSIELKLPEKSLILDYHNSNNIFSRYVPVNGGIMKFYTDVEEDYEIIDNIKITKYILKICIDLNV